MPLGFKIQFFFIRSFILVRYFLKKKIFGIQKKSKNGRIDSSTRRKAIKLQKSIMCSDLRNGNRLGEISLSPTETYMLNMYFLGQFIPASNIIGVYEKHRGYKISENPAIYKKFANKR